MMFPAQAITISCSPACLRERVPDRADEGALCRCRSHTLARPLALAKPRLRFGGARSRTFSRRQAGEGECRISCAPVSQAGEGNACGTKTAVADSMGLEGLSQCPKQKPARSESADTRGMGT